MTPGFFMQAWELLGPGLHRGFQHILDSGVMPERFSEGLIFLIPKGEGVSDDIRQWRPITILNTVYKVLAKALSLRIQPFLGEPIHATQLGLSRSAVSLTTSLLSGRPLLWLA